MEPVDNSNDPSKQKQDQTGSKTGLSPEAFAQLIENEISTWREKGNKPAILLTALCRLVQAKPGQAGEGYAPLEIANAMNELLGPSKAWPKNDEADIPTEVRKLWYKLDELWGTKMLGLEQCLSNHGHPVKPVIDINPQG